MTSTMHPTLSFYLRETYRICNFLVSVDRDNGRVSRINQRQARAVPDCLKLSNETALIDNALNTIHRNRQTA